MIPKPARSGPIPIPYPNVSASPPKALKPLTKEVLPAEFQSILARLQQKYGAGLQVKVTDSQWVEISVANLPAKQLQAQLQLARKALFGSAEPRMQVIQPLGSTGPGIFLHLLREPVWGDLATMAVFAKK